MSLTTIDEAKVPSANYHMQKFDVKVPRKHVTTISGLPGTDFDDKLNWDIRMQD